MKLIDNSMKLKQFNEVAKQFNDVAKQFNEVKTIQFNEVAHKVHL